MKSTFHTPLNRWRHYRRAPFIGLSPVLHSWLLDRGSLTQRLIEASDGNLSVRKITQGWQRPTRSEAKRLGIRSGELALVREVELVCHGEPWVYARSVFPMKTLTGRLRWLKNLDSRPLGAMLFKDPSMRRTLFEIAPLDSQKVFPQEHKDKPTILWGRRSLFFLDHKPILVAEIFLPALEKHALQEN